MSEYLTTWLPANALDALHWRGLGPWRGGRVMAVCGHAAHPETFYFGSSGGGVWRTDNGGATWRPLGDGVFRRGAVGAIAVAPSAPDVVYVGTGECGLRSNVTGGDGVYATADGGETWRHCGLAATQNIARVIVHPRDENTVYVAAFGHRFGPNPERGVYRSRDGGRSWAQVLFHDAGTGAIDLAMDPDNLQVWYAVMWRAGRTPWGFTSGGEGSGIWKTTDGGDTWSDLTPNLGLAHSRIGRIGLTVSPADPRRLYVLIEADGANGRTGVYRSLDRGRTWAWTSDEPNLAVRPWYFGQIVADPRDADTVYVPHRKLWKSVDGGRSFRQLNTTYWDQHALWVSPADPRVMALGNDGGAAISRDGGATWSTILNQPTAEMYRVTTDTRFPYRVYSAQQDNSTISLPHRSALGPPSQMDWYDVGGGESGHIAVRPDNPDVVYAASFAGEITRYDHATGDQRTISVWPEASDGWGAESVKYRFNWSTPVVLSPHDPNVLYVCGNHVFRSADEGRSWDITSPDLTRADATKMGRAGGPITYDSSGTDYYGTITAFAESPLQRGVLWAGSDDGLVHLSRDNGVTWTNVTPPDLPEWANVNTIEPSPFDAAGAYVAVSNQKQDDFRPLLYRTGDGGVTWTPITAGIPADEFCRVVRADPDRPGLLYAGTEGGVWMSLDDGAAWRPFSQNLPAVTVYDLAVKNRDLIAATHGRGLWVLDDLSPLHTLTADALAATAYLFPPRPTVRVARAVFGISNMIALSYPFAADNPPAGVVFHYWLPEGTRRSEITLVIRDNDGTVTGFSSIPGWRQYYEIQRRQQPLGPYRYHLRGSGSVLERKGPGEEEMGVRVGVLPPEMQAAPESSGLLPVRPGLNRFAWDMLYNGAFSLFEDYHPGGITTPLALPGTYTAALTVSGETYTTTFEITRHPLMSATDTDLAAQFALMVRIRDTVVRVYTFAHRLERFSEEVSRIDVRGLRGGSLANDLRKAIYEQLDDIRDRLVPVRLSAHAGEQESLNTPLGLNGKLEKLGYWVARGEAAPTRQDVQVYEHLAAQVQDEMNHVKEIMATDLAALNTELPALDIAPVSPINFVQWDGKALRT